MRGNSFNGPKTLVIKKFLNDLLEPLLKAKQSQDPKHMNILQRLLSSEEVY
jgi:hypothetical protein